MAASSMLMCSFRLMLITTLVLILPVFSTNPENGVETDSQDTSLKSQDEPISETATTAADASSPETTPKPVEDGLLPTENPDDLAVSTSTTTIEAEDQTWPEQVLSSVTESFRYFLAVLMSELQKEIELFASKDEVNTTGEVSNLTVISINETVVNETVATNSTTEEVSGTELEKNETVAKKPRFHCTGKNITENSTGIVQMVNGTTLLQRLTFENNASGSDCILVFFYAPWCHFSAQAAPNYNTLGRAFPQLDIIAVDAVQFSSLNARFGVVSVPNIMFFHHSRSVVRFNSSKKTFENMVLFVKNMTGLEAEKSVEIAEGDMIGPIPSTPTSEPDCLLWLAWTFINVCSLYMFYSSSMGQHMINKIHTLWQEHQHIE